MKKRKMGNTIGALGSSLNRSKDGMDLLSTNEYVDDESTLKINQLIPQARDGHSSIVYKGILVLFGGDRHHMPFNDLFMLDLEDFFFADYD